MVAKIFGIFEHLLNKKASEDDEVSKGQRWARYPYCRREDGGRNTRREIIRLLEVSPGDSGGHSVLIGSGSPMDPRSGGHLRICWVCHDGSSQFVVTGDQHVFFRTPYPKTLPLPIVSSSNIPCSSVTLTG